MKKTLLTIYCSGSMFLIAQGQTTSTSQKNNGTIAVPSTILKTAKDSANYAIALKNIEAGKKFLVSNANKPGIKTTSSGLQYEVVKEGSGAKPTLADTAVAHFVGKYIDGKEFDNSYLGEEPVTFPVAKMIKGWIEGLQLMTPGSKYVFYIPNELAYGTVEKPKIPAGSSLIYEIELIEVKKK